MHCRDCSRFDPELRKCRDQKVNPITWAEAVDVANVMGLRSICMFNDHREKLVVSRTLPDRYPARRKA
jgi:hypothetical protein